MSTPRVSAAITRRRLLQTSAGVAAAAWLPSFRVPPAAAQSGCAPPARFPPDIEVYQQGYQNWAKAIVIDDLWTCAPKSPAEVVRLANWAHREGWRLRPRGAMHNWSPLCVTAGTNCESRVVLVDTTEHLTAIEILAGELSAVRAGAGVSMLALSEALERHGLGFATIPATGDPTVGGGLAIGMHGAALPARGEQRALGHSYGSLSNLIVALTAVVWSARRRRYELREFERSDPDAKAFLVHLGRAFVVEVTLRVGANQNMRCVSYTDIPASELFASPGSPGQSFASFVDESGRAESIQFQFTENPWLKVWSVSPAKPAGSREVDSPYNYPFSDNVPEQVTDLVAQILAGNPGAAPLLGQVEYGLVTSGLAALSAGDIWGKSKNVLLYIKQTTLRVDECGFAIVTARRHLQRVVSEFYAFYSRLLEEHRARGSYPINGPLEIRACGLDRPGHAEVAGAEPASLAATTPRRDRPDWDIAVFCNSLTTPGTPGEYGFMREIERWARSNYSGYATLRPEWSKGWAFTDEAIWADRRSLSKRIPRSLTLGRRADEDWDWARARLNRYDPHRVFSNHFLDRLLPG